MSVFAIVFWLWFLVSAVILIRRRVTRRANGAAVGTAPATAASVVSDDSSASTGTEADASLGSDHSPDDELCEDYVQALVDDGFGTADIGDGPCPTNVDAPPDRTMEPSPAPEPDLDTRISDPPPPAALDSARGSMDSTLGISDALSGIKMPCDLAPLTVGVESLNPAQVDLVTTGVGPDDVAAQLDKELTRLGYDVAELGEGEHLATRGETVVRVKVHDRPAVSVGSDGRGFPTAPADGIVVELSLAS